MRANQRLAVGTTSSGPPGARAVHETKNITTFVITGAKPIPIRTSVAPRATFFCEDVSKVAPTY